MDALELLKTDHDTVRGLFQQFREAERSGDMGALEELAGEIAEELTIHAEIEEHVFYPAVRQMSNELDKLVEEGLEEHQEVKQLLERIDGMAPQDDGFASSMTQLIDDVEHHATEEENEMFPKMLSALPDTTPLLGDDLATRKIEVEQQVRTDRGKGMAPSTTNQKNTPGPESGFQTG